MAHGLIHIPYPQNVSHVKAILPNICTNISLANDLQYLYNQLLKIISDEYGWIHRFYQT